MTGYERLVQRLEASREARIVEQAQSADIVTSVLESNNSPIGLLAQGVLELGEDMVLQLKRKQGRFLVGMIRKHRREPKGHVARKVYQASGPAQSIRQVDLPVDTTTREGSYTVQENWSIRLQGFPLPPDMEICRIFRRSQETGSNAVDLALAYEVVANKVTRQGMDSFHASIWSYTDGVQDDPFITEAKNAIGHVQGLIVSARQELRKLSVS